MFIELKPCIDTFDIHEIQTEILILINKTQNVTKVSNCKQKPKEKDNRKQLI